MARYWFSMRGYTPYTRIVELAVAQGGLHVAPCWGCAICCVWAVKQAAARATTAAWAWAQHDDVWEVSLAETGL